MDRDGKKQKKKKPKPDLFSPIEPGQKKPKENEQSPSKEMVSLFFIAQAKFVNSYYRSPIN
jgi:hypothetical protein